MEASSTHKREKKQEEDTKKNNFVQHLAILATDCPEWRVLLWRILFLVSILTIITFAGPGISWQHFFLQFYWKVVFGPSFNSICHVAIIWVSPFKKKPLVLAIYCVSKHENTLLKFNVTYYCEQAQFFLGQTCLKLNSLLTFVLFTLNVKLKTRKKSVFFFFVLISPNTSSIHVSIHACAIFAACLLFDCGFLLLIISLKISFF